MKNTDNVDKVKKNFEEEIKRFRAWITKDYYHDLLWELLDDSIRRISIFAPDVLNKLILVGDPEQIITKDGDTTSGAIETENIEKAFKECINFKENLIVARWDAMTVCSIMHYNEPLKKRFDEAYTISYERLEQMMFSIVTVYSYAIQKGLIEKD